MIMDGFLGKIVSIRDKYLFRGYEEDEFLDELSNIIANTYEISARQAAFHLEQYFDNHPLFIANRKGKREIILKRLKESVNYALYKNGLEPVFVMETAPFSQVYEGYCSRPSAANVVRGLTS
jgi:hypothetical protein